MMCRTTLALMTAATLTLGGLSYGQENTRPQVTPPRNADADRPANDAGAAMDRAANHAVAGMSRDAENIRKLANDPMASDKLFAMMAAAGNQWEIAFNNMVAERATTQEIKDHARMIAQDHQQAQQRLEAMAQKLDVTLPASLPPEKQAKLDVFRAMPVDKLETCWITEMRAGHAKDITSYADHTKTLQNEDLRTYASETLPKLRQHGSEVNRIAATKGLTDGAAPAGPAPTMNH